jgi:predicted DNA-binding transcriptional regulator AlpA
MATLTTRQAAKKLGIDAGTLSRYISAKKIPEPKVVQIGSFRVHSWTNADIERIRKLLPKIANGRKMRYQKLREKQKTQAKAPVSRKQKKK